MAVDNAAEDHDILILGAGLSGINTAHRLRKTLPHRSFTILEKADHIGGTWAFWRYPGFRCDSYMTTFGLSWFPWPHRKMMVPAGEILEYLNQAASHDGSKDKIRFKHNVRGLEWRSDESKWRLDVDADGTSKVITANFVIACTGYYSYERAFPVQIPGLDDFQGQVVHPQWWPENLDYSGKRVVVVGSGATAVTVVPEIGKTAERITMLQRSPAYIMSRSNSHPVGNFLRYLLPLSWVATICWYLDLWLEIFISRTFLRYPGVARWIITEEARKMLPKHVDADVHFNPSYGPFEQRVGFCPQADFFKALHRENTEIVTDVIDTVTKDGILLKSGRKLDADIIVTATGLYFQLLDGMKPVVDGQAIDLGSQYGWRGCMLESLPNSGMVFGYVTQTYTPGADIMARTLIKVIQKMEAKGATSVMPVIERTKGMPKKLAVEAKSSYFVKAADRIPKATNQGPWYGRISYLVDLAGLWFGSMEEGLVYSSSGKDKHI